MKLLFMGTAWFGLFWVMNVGLLNSSPRCALWVKREDPWELNKQFPGFRPRKSQTDVS